jgi:hypothetical protein
MESSGKDNYLRLAKALGGVKRFGRETPIPILEVMARLGVWEAMDVLRRAEWPEINPARALAADLAGLSLKVYERFRPWCRAPLQAVEAAAAFAAGIAGKGTLAAVHKLAEAAAERCIIAEALRPPEHYAALAAVAASDPFGRPGEMVWSAWQNASMALDYGTTDVFLVAGQLLDKNSRIFGRLAHRFGDTDGALAFYHDAIREACFTELNRTELSRQAHDRATASILRMHLTGEVRHD